MTRDEQIDDMLTRIGQRCNPDPWSTIGTIFADEVKSLREYIDDLRIDLANSAPPTLILPHTCTCRAQGNVLSVTN